MKDPDDEYTLTANGEISPSRDDFLPPPVSEVDHRDAWWFEDGAEVKTSHAVKSRTLD